MLSVLRVGHDKGSRNLRAGVGMGGILLEVFLLRDRVMVQ